MSEDELLYLKMKFCCIWGGWNDAKVPHLCLKISSTRGLLSWARMRGSYFRWKVFPIATNRSHRWPADTNHCFNNSVVIIEVNTNVILKLNNFFPLQNNTHITYRNTIRHNVPSNIGEVTRSTAYNILVTCAIARDGFPERNLQPQGQRAPDAIGTGQFQINMELYRSDRFVSPIRVNQS